MDEETLKAFYDATARVTEGKVDMWEVAAEVFEGTQQSYLDCLEAASTSDMDAVRYFG